MKTSAIALSLASLAPLQGALVDVYFGTQGGQAQGIYRAKLDSEKGTLSQIELAAEIASSGFLAFHPDRKKLYVAGKNEDEASVAAYRVLADGALAFINFQPIGDGGAAHLSVHPSGEFLLTAQYGGSSVGVFPINADGLVGPRAQLIEHGPGAGGSGGRMDKAHPHWTGYSPDGRFAFVSDLGMNRIVIYKVVPGPTFIEAAGSAESVAGGGARHMKFSVDGKFVYLLNELTLSVTTFAYDAQTGQMRRLTTTPALSEAAKAKESFNSASEIVVHPSGKFVYSANRGHDSVTAYRANPATGKLIVTDVEPIRGSWPRNINLESTGRWLLAAGAHSNTISVFEIDQESGALRFPTRAIYEIPRCICILFNE